MNMAMYTLKIGNDTTVEVMFAIATNSVTVTVGLWGIVTVGSVVVAGGTSQTFQVPAGGLFTFDVNPLPGYVASVSVGGVAIQPDA